MIIIIALIAAAVLGVAGGYWLRKRDEEPDTERCPMKADDLAWCERTRRINAVDREWQEMMDSMPVTEPIPDTLRSPTIGVEFEAMDRGTMTSGESTFHHDVLLINDNPEGYRIPPHTANPAIKLALKLAEENHRKRC